MFVNKLHHVKGAFIKGSYDLKKDQDEITNEFKALKENISVHENISNQSFFNLIENANKGDIIVFDGHGSKDGSIFVSNTPIKGSILAQKMKKSNAILYLDSCFAVFASRYQKLEEDQYSNNDDLLNALRNEVANLCSFNEESSAPVKIEVDQILDSINKDTLELTPVAFRKRIVSALVTRGLDRCPYKIVPLSIGGMPAGSEGDIISLSLRKDLRGEEQRTGCVCLCPCF